MGLFIPAGRTIRNAGGARRPAILPPPDRRNPYRHLDWRGTIQRLREIGPAGIEGFVRALESRHSPTRVFASHMLQTKKAPPPDEAVADLLKSALKDPNRKVRRNALEALLGGSFDSKLKADAFVPLVMGLLHDPSTRVRRAATYELIPWAAQIPLAEVVKAFLNEADHECRKRQKMLMHAIVHHEVKFYCE